MNPDQKETLSYLFDTLSDCAVVANQSLNQDEKISTTLGDTPAGDFMRIRSGIELLLLLIGALIPEHVEDRIISNEKRDMN